MQGLIHSVARRDMASRLRPGRLRTTLDRLAPVRACIVRACFVGVCFVGVCFTAGCSTDEDDGCSAGACPAGTVCDAASGRCTPVDGTGAVHGGLGIWVSSALTSAGELVVAAWDTNFRSLVVGSLMPEALDADGLGTLGPVSRLRDDTQSGGWPSLALTADDAPRLAYYDAGAGDLRIARWIEGAWHFDLQPADGGEPVDEGGAAEADVGRYASLTVDAAGGLHVAYRDDTNRALRILSLGDSGCHPPGGVPGDPVIIDSAVMAEWGMPSQDVGTWTSIAIGPDGWLAVAFYDAGRGNLVMARCSGAELTLQLIDGEDPETGEDTGDVGAWASLAVDHAVGRIGVAYFDRGRGVLKFADSRQGALQVVTVDDGASETGQHLVGQAAALDYYRSTELAESLPRIVYLDATDRSLRIARRTVFGGWTTDAEVVQRLPDEVVGGLGVGLDLAVDRDDNAWVTFGRWTVVDGEVVMDMGVRRCTPELCPAGASSGTDGDAAERAREGSR